MLLRFASVSCWLLGLGLASAQPTGPKPTRLPLNDLSAFRPARANWSVVGDVMANPYQESALTVQPGTSVLANQMPKPTYGDQYNLLTNMEHGDLDIELDYMIAKGSNSGVYLQGRYEVQLYDSWGVKNPTVTDNGSIYERWDEARPKGTKGFEGYPAHQNAGRAPGLWQHLKISFQAPRFDATGKKIANARMLRVELNGVLLHENVELYGPTRAAAFTDEKAVGPLMLQGDHGSVAFRNIQYTSYDKVRPALSDISFSVYKGRFDKFDQEPVLSKLAFEEKGTAPELTPSVSHLSNDFVVQYKGILKVAEPGEYAFDMALHSGGGNLKINNQTVVKPFQWEGKGTATLPAGNLPFELTYTKTVDWLPPSMRLAISGPGFRQFVMSSAIGEEPETDPILVDANQTPILRSFMDLSGVPGPKGGPYRVVHAVSVSGPEQVYYTYDLDNGALVQVWRGQFLDSTPMWHDRGDGSSRPMGMVQHMGKPALFLTKLANNQAEWPKDTTGSSFRPKGYVLDANDKPTFRYYTNGSLVNDAVRPLENGQGVHREVTIENAGSGLTARLAEAGVIKQLDNGLYLIDGLWYIRPDSGTSPVIRTVNGRQELIAPVANGKVSYSLLF
ncbi:3-keto-disaccharide hydrolase [Arsenicibacter rosenii]|uniref:PA14 domain-containing protein n=1 Tax=Arsenicibacter rosenii TaxID=1750698 RepID=A0A1S2VB79_9BACT|nr:DUF1080 domain-containing protein [Arsenicibacter rosenii]OIN56007.1 hypothetical protein BLX24_27040 [Arsenicibacter rosenii]